jgi:ATP synthase subunit 6
MNVIYSPLEQFEIVVLKPLSFFSLFDISITNSTLYMLFTALCILSFLVFGVYNATIVPSTYWQSLVESTYEFIYDMLKQQTGSQGQQYFPIIFLTFLFILFSNLLGLMPFGFTTTGHIIVTFTLALSFNLGLLYTGFALHGLKFLKLFVPSNVPIAIIPLITVIEIVSYSIRTFSLSLRLFANMMAGHTLLNILSSFVIAMYNAGYAIVGIVPFILVLAITVLEFGIAFLQAYVFVILLCIYLNDALHPGH